VANRATSNGHRPAAPRGLRHQVPEAPPRGQADGPGAIPAGGAGLRRISRLTPSPAHRGRTTRGRSKCAGAKALPSTGRILRRTRLGRETRTGGNPKPRLSGPGRSVPLPSMIPTCSASIPTFWSTRTVAIRSGTGQPPGSWPGWQRARSLGTSLGPESMNSSPSLPIRESIFLLLPFRRPWGK
jgi:hypothetical protein